jgi:hypothetical protein
MFDPDIHKHVTLTPSNNCDLVCPLRVLSPEMAVRKDLVQYVATALGPLLELFDLYKLPEDIYHREVALIANPMIGIRS